MVVNFNYQLDYYYNHLEDTTFGYVYKVSSGEISLGWKEPPPNVGAYHFMGWGPGLNKKRKEYNQVNYSYLCFLAVEAMCSDFSCFHYHAFSIINV